MEKMEYFSVLNRTSGLNSTHEDETKHNPLMAHYKNLLIQIIQMGQICQNDMIQNKDIFQIVATWLQFSTE